MPRKFTDAQEREIRRLYDDERLSTVEIAKQYGCAHSTVGRIIRRLGGTVTKRALTSEQERQVVCDYEAGLVMQAVADKHGVSRAVVQRTLAKHGIEARTPLEYHRKFSEADEAQIAADYESGATMKTVAAEQDTTVDTVRKILNRQNTRQRTRSENQRTFSDDEEAEIADLYRAGLSQREAACAYGTTREVVAGALERQGVHIRSQSEAERFYSDDEEALLLEMYESGYKQVEIADYFGCNRQTVANILIRRGVPLRDGMFYDHELDEIIRLYLDEELFIYEIAGRFGVSDTAVNNALVSRNVTIREENRFYEIDHHVFDRIDDEASAYWLGFIYADGHVPTIESRNTNILQVILQSSDAAHLEKLNRVLGSNKPIRIDDYMPYERIVLSVSSPYISNALRRYGIIVGRNRIDLALAAIPNELLHHFVRGFFDGDGCASKAYAKISFSGQLDIMRFLRSFFTERAGRNPNLKIGYGNNTRTLAYKGSHNARAVVRAMYADATVWLDRKLDVIKAWPAPKHTSKPVH